MTYRSKLSYLFIPAILALALPAFAQDATECASDADCDAGYACQKGMSVSPCDLDGDCDPTPHEEEFGTCEKQPESCESNADCGEYLSCQSSMGGDCWASSDGSSGCSEPDPDAPHYCAPALTECEIDSDCPRSFACVSQEKCPAVDCAEGETCDKPACEPAGGLCMPAEVECEVDADCPSEWSCVISTEYSCSGGDGDVAPEPDSGGAEDGSEDPVDDTGAPPDEIEEEVCTEVESIGSCQPDAWEGAYTGGDVATDGEATAGEDLLGPGAVDDDAKEGGDATNSSDDASSEAGGCSVAPTRTGTPGPLGLLLLVGAPLVMLRRRMTGLSQ